MNKVDTSNVIKPVSQILVYTSLNYAGEGIKKELILSMVNVYGVLDETMDLFYIYDANKNYIGVIDTKCVHTTVAITWGNKED